MNTLDLISNLLVLWCTDFTLALEEYFKYSTSQKLQVVVALKRESNLYPNTEISELYEALVSYE